MTLTARATSLEHDPGEIRDRAADLLSRPPYRQDEGMLSRAWRAVREWVADALQRVVDLVAADPATGWAVVAVGVLVLVAVVWRATRGLALDRATEPTVDVTGGGWSAAQWHAHADEQRLRGHHAEAVRARYIALVTGLVEQGTIEDVPGRTVGELDRELEARAPDMAATVAAAGAIFAEVFYGREPARAEQAEQLARLAARVDVGVGAHARAGTGGRRP